MMTTDTSSLLHVCFLWSKWKKIIRVGGWGDWGVLEVGWWWGGGVGDVGVGEGFAGKVLWSIPDAVVSPWSTRKA